MKVCVLEGNRGPVEPEFLLKSSFLFVVDFDIMVFGLVYSTSSINCFKGRKINYIENIEYNSWDKTTYEKSTDIHTTLSVTVVPKLVSLSLHRLTCNATTLTLSSGEDSSTFRRQLFRSPSFDENIKFGRVVVKRSGPPRRKIVILHTED